MSWIFLNKWNVVQKRYQRSIKRIEDKWLIFVTTFLKVINYICHSRYSTFTKILNHIHTISSFKDKDWWHLSYNLKPSREFNLKHQSYFINFVLNWSHYPNKMLYYRYTDRQKNKRLSKYSITPSRTKFNYVHFMFRNLHFSGSLTNALRENRIYFRKPIFDHYIHRRQRWDFTF